MCEMIDRQAYEAERRHIREQGIADDLKAILARLESATSDLFALGNAATVAELPGTAADIWSLQYEIDKLIPEYEHRTELPLG